MDNKILPSALFPVYAVAFALRIEGAYWGIGAIPPAVGWASVLALLATGVTALTLLRSLPEMGAALGAFGIAGVSYLVGAVLDAVLLALFKGRGGERR